MNKLLLFPEVTEGGVPGKTSITAPVQLTPSTSASKPIGVGKTTNASNPKPRREGLPPAEALALNFSVEQLPISSNDLPEMPATEGKLLTEVEVKGDESNTTIPADKLAKVEGKRVEEKRPVDTKSVEEKKSEATNSLLKPPGSSKAKDEGKGDTSVIEQFDYKDYTPQETEYLKNMSRPARNFASNLIKQNRELAKVKVDSYHQHPNAYVLHPEFQQLNINVHKASMEEQFWATQLEKCKKGEKVRDLAGYNQQGELVSGNEIEPNSSIEEKIRVNMMQTSQMASKFRNDLQNFPKQYQNNTNNVFKGIEEHRHQYFDWVKNPELMEYEFTDKNGATTSVKDARNKFLNIWPSFMRQDKGVQVAADLMVALILSDAQNAELLKGKQVADIIKEEGKRVEPSSQIRPGRQPESVNGSPTMFHDDPVLSEL